MGSECWLADTRKEKIMIEGFNLAWYGVGLLAGLAILLPRMLP